MLVRCFDGISRNFVKLAGKVYCNRCGANVSYNKKVEFNMRHSGQLLVLKKHICKDQLSFPFQ